MYMCVHSTTSRYSGQVKAVLKTEIVPDCDTYDASIVGQLHISSIRIGGSWKHCNANSRQIQFGARWSSAQIQVAARAGWQETLDESVAIRHG
jgi:hypothetical protein